MSDTITVPRELAERTKRELQAAADRMAALEAKVRELEAELETERMRLAGCGVAALGYFDGCKDEYKSASLGDVFQLRDQLAASRQQVERLVEALTEICKHCANPITQYGYGTQGKPWARLADFVFMKLREALAAVEKERGNVEGNRLAAHEQKQER